MPVDGSGALLHSSRVSVFVGVEVSTGVLNISCIRLVSISALAISTALGERYRE